MLKKVIVIVGPTATGKSAVAIEISKKLNCEIISADSMQIYRDMIIGTAAPTPEEQDGIRHHLLNFVEPDIKYNAALFQKEAFLCINDILSRGKTPVVVGGTGLYINSITYKLDFTQTSENQALRALLEKQYDEAPRKMYDEMISRDPACFGRIHENDKKRIVRRMEILNSGREESYDFNIFNNDYDFTIIGLNKDRAVLYADINKRVDKMMNAGLLSEAETVYKKYGDNITAFSAIGYKEFLPFFNGSAQLEETVEKIKQNTRHFAKRQLTWFKRDKRIVWYSVDEYDNIQKLSDKIIADNFYGGNIN